MGLEHALFCTTLNCANQLIYEEKIETLSAARRVDLLTTVVVKYYNDRECCDESRSVRMFKSPFLSGILHVSFL